MTESESDWWKDLSIPTKDPVFKIGEILVPHNDVLSIIDIDIVSRYLITNNIDIKKPYRLLTGVNTLQKLTNCTAIASCIVTWMASILL